MKIVPTFLLFLFLACPFSLGREAVETPQLYALGHYEGLIDEVGFFEKISQKPYAYYLKDAQGKRIALLNFKHLPTFKPWKNLKGKSAYIQGALRRSPAGLVLDIFFAKIK